MNHSMVYVHLSNKLTDHLSISLVYDNDLEFLVRYSLKNQLELGVDIGVVSYNDTPLKGIIASGITTISTDFVQMGKTMADMILNQRKLWIDNPFVMNIRSSF